MPLINSINSRYVHIILTHYSIHSILLDKTAHLTAHFSPSTHLTTIYSTQTLHTGHLTAHLTAHYRTCLTCYIRIALQSTQLKYYTPHSLQTAHLTAHHHTCLTCYIRIALQSTQLKHYTPHSLQTAHLTAHHRTCLTCYILIALHSTQLKHNTPH